MLTGVTDMTYNGQMAFDHILGKGWFAVRSDSVTPTTTLSTKTCSSGLNSDSFAHFCPNCACSGPVQYVLAYDCFQRTFKWRIGWIRKETRSGGSFITTGMALAGFTVSCFNAWRDNFEQKHVGPVDHAMVHCTNTSAVPCTGTIWSEAGSRMSERCSDQCYEFVYLAVGIEVIYSCDEVSNVQRDGVHS